MQYTLGRFTRLKESSLGFTLIEIMIVIAVVGIFATVTIPKYQGLTDHYHLESSAQIVAGQMRNAKQYAMDRRADVYVMFNATSVQIFYFNNDSKEYISLETQETFDTGITFVRTSSIGVDTIPTNDGVNNIPLAFDTADDRCLVFDRKGFLKISPVNIVLTNTRSTPQIVSVDLTSDSLAVKITWR